MHFRVSTKAPPYWSNDASNLIREVYNRVKCIHADLKCWFMTFKYGNVVIIRAVATITAMS